MPAYSKPWELPYEQRFKDRLPHVMIGFLAFGDVSPEFFESCVYWAFQSGSRYRDKFIVSMNIAQRREQYRARNGLVRLAQECGADFILMVDDDHTLLDCPTMLGDFYAEEKPLQGGLYVRRISENLEPVIQSYDPETGICRWSDWSEVPLEGGPVDILGGGLNWIDMSLFDFIREPFWWPYPLDRADGLARKDITFKPDLKYGLDLQLCLAAREIGVQPWLNGRVKVGHIVQDRAVLRPPGMNKHIICPGCDTIAPWNPDTSRNECPRCGPS